MRTALALHWHALGLLRLPPYPLHPVESFLSYRTLDASRTDANNLHAETAGAPLARNITSHYVAAR